MTTPADAASMLQKLGPRLFEQSGQTLTQVELSAARSDFRGLAVAAPPQVQTDAQSSVPVVVLSQQTVLRAWQVAEQYNLMLAVTDLDTGSTRLARALVDPKDEDVAGNPLAPARPPPPTGSAAAGISTKVHRFEVRVSPGQSGTLAVAALSFDTASNATTVALAGGRPRVAGHARPVAPQPNPSSGLPSYAPTARSPKPPRAGVEFQVDAAPAAADALVVHGAFTKALAQNESLTVPRTLRDNGADRQATAVVPLTLAIVGLDWKAPRLQALAVPVYGSAALSTGQRLSGYFAAPLAIGAPLPAGEYLAYVFMDGVPHGPQRFELR